MCNCYPKISYFLWKLGAISDPDVGLFSNIYTYGIIIGLSLISLLLAFHWDQDKISKNIWTISALIAVFLIQNFTINVVAEKYIFTLSTSFVLSTFLLFAFYRIRFSVKHLFKWEFFFLSLAISRFACHITGDGHWGKSISTLDKYPILQNLFSDCSFKHNINLEGFLDNHQIEYGRTLSEAVIPSSLLESLGYLVLFIIYFLTKKYRKHRKVFLFITLVVLLKYLSFIFLLPDQDAFSLFFLPLLLIVSLLGFIFSPKLNKIETSNE